MADVLSKEWIVELRAKSNRVRVGVQTTAAGAIERYVTMSPDDADALLDRLAKLEAERESEGVHHWLAACGVVWMFGQKDKQLIVEMLRAAGITRAVAERCGVDNHYDLRMIALLDEGANG